MKAEKGGTFKETVNKYLTLKEDQYYIFTIKKGKPDVDDAAFIDELAALGIYRKDGVVVRVVDNVISTIDPQSIHYIINEKIKLLEPYETYIGDNPIVLPPRSFINAWAKYGRNVNFGKSDVIQKLPEHDGEVLRDTKTTIYACFNNGYVQITAKDIKLLPYSALKGRCVWKSRIIKHDIDLKAKGKSQYSIFVKNLSGKNSKREQDIVYALGYLCHNFHQPSKARVVLLYDETTKKGQQGGTGKDVLIQGVAKLRTTKVLDGKRWKARDENDKFFGSVSRETQVVCISDPSHQNLFESLFVKSQGPFTSDKKYGVEVDIPMEDTPKIAVTSNIVFDASDSSNKRRQIPILINGFYRDLKLPTPIVKVHGKEFYTEWDAKEYNLFYRDMLNYIHIYLGMPEPEQDFKGLTRQSFLIRHGLLGKFILDYIEPKLPPEVVVSDLADAYMDTYIELPKDDTLRNAEVQSIKTSVAEVLSKWLDTNEIQYIRKRKMTKDGKKTIYQFDK